MSAFSFTQLAAFVYTGSNLSDWHLDQFAAIGGRYIMPVVMQLSHPDDATCAWNRTNFEALRVRCDKRGIRMGAQFNGWGGDPVADAATIAKFVLDHNVVPVCLDLEAYYQWPEHDASLTPKLLLELRKLLPVGTRAVAVSTNGLNASMIWNGRIGGTMQPGDKSCHDLAIRVMSQWYDAYARGVVPGIPSASPWADPEYNMRWLRDNGADPGNWNFYDGTAPLHRGLPLGWVKGTVEVTGLEGSILQNTLDSCMRAKMYGFSQGIQLYTLDGIPAGDPYKDFPRIAKYRGVLYAA